ncbi:MAG: M23 family metallopeptidase [Thiothrix sp.]|uniref:M23 family metallopeptidase n=1 Tax=Thiothrix sp. TaxID=1032 RepID=UPI0026113FC1|nr:M23 family metallopeptidase [Thiothrix sp.]MDD5394122.1 M23 family metallopeptidase [Thiothrix sp.]
MQRYNFPVGGIEIRIPSDYKPKPAAVAAPSSTLSKKSFRYIATRSLFLACGLATLGNIPVYSMINTPAENQTITLEQPADADSPAQVLKDLNLPAVAVESFSGFSVDILPDAEQGNWAMRTIADDDTLASALSKLKLDKAAKPLLENASIKQELQALKTDSHLLAQTVDGHLQQLIYAKDKTHAYIVSLTDDGYVGKWEDNVFEIRDSRLAFTVKYSVQRDGKEAGLSNSLIRQLGQVFQKDVSFKNGVKIGDKVGVIFEDFHYQGETIYTDKILAAEYTTGSTTFQRVRFSLSGGKADYFQPNADTELKRAAFDRVPVTGARMSSGFGIRIHPVFGFRKAHTGQDFAAPHGTPIHATADGSIKFMGRQNGYGNVVELRHVSGVTTLYGHMSAFKQGLASGESVHRGDVIGYVGSTGTSTGNHVHYEYRINGSPQNPATAQLPETGIMTAEEAHSFKSYAMSMVEQLADLRKLASLDKPPTTQPGG